MIYCRKQSFKKDLAIMIRRIYRVSSKSFFLFGPRGVGKSTWIKSRGGFDLLIDLLKHSTFLDLQREPSLLEAKTAHLQKGQTVFIDEIQKIPALLDEVHRIMEEKKLNFILTGSSARKLKRAGANLLAGRAHTYKMFPLTFREIGSSFTLEDLFRVGTLPVVLNDIDTAEETLASYVETYLREEIKEEAIVRRVDDFARFLAIAGHLNGNVINAENVAREAGKSANTIQNWFQILEETLLGSFLAAYRPGFKVRESAHPKFYWFDPAVARVAAGLAWRDIDSVWKGVAFESMILREIRAFLEVSRKKMNIYYYSTPGAGEIDFIVETRPKTINRPQQFVSIEVKHTVKWKREFESASRALKASKPESHLKMIGVYLGNERLYFDGFEVLPLQEFIRDLFEAKIF
jgi:predicted AAA+ superfamily ATPase